MLILNTYDRPLNEAIVLCYTDIQYSVIFLNKSIFIFKYNCLHI